ncbi:hypothetical protein BN59_01101 [Legionella massiliensis]|uniref:Uncharacterized protein n=1 Tax=Legionella massiliensis TaxID=1034943 RepID=A0A078KQY4_9GAMM|nr:hypothetical protein [Legionella massiliensis]CDZ76825.1 hypothetical protein BN59_01101 [Legionella massiliensis]CEE12563.1 hypothetical protein BN1094_01101 [Legionella massiliensis]
MKYFGPASGNEKYSYNEPTYLRSFGVASYMINETDFNKLERSVRDALERGDDRSSLLYAGKAAIEYGVAGLLLYIDTYITILSKPSAKDEMIEQEVIKLLAYIGFAKQMLEIKDAKALKSMQIIYSDDYDSDSYWKKREVKLLSLIDDTELVLSESKDMADALVKECLKDNQSQNKHPTYK